MKPASWAVIALALASASCSPEGEPAEDALTEYRLEWAKLADGSDFARINRPGAFDNALRCWDGTGDYSGMKQCVGASKHHGTGAVYVAQRTETELPEIVINAGSTHRGYGCGEVMGDIEQISNDGDTLVSNRLDRGVSRWTQAFVRDYMADNGVKGTPWFDCLAILNEIQGGSIATLGTTSINRDMAGT